MTDVSVIRQLVRRARRRIRVQALLDATVAALIPAVVVGLLGTIVLVIGPPQIAIGLFGLAIAVILAAALVATARPLEDAEVCRRIDRTSDLADRLATALAFAERKQPDGFELLAIADGVRAAGQARVEEATRLRVPPATPVALGVVAVALAAGTIAVPPLARMQADDTVVAEVATDEHELEFHSPLYGPFEHPLRHVRQVAWDEVNPGLVAITEELEAQLRAFGRQGISKDRLLVKLVDAERLAARLHLSRRAQLALASAGDSIRRLAELAPPAPVPEEADVIAGVASARGPLEEAVVTSSHRGNASAEYKTIYQQYQRQLEETQHNEKVPAAYRAYVKRYFDTIRTGDKIKPNR